MIRFYKLSDLGTSCPTCRQPHELICGKEVTWGERKGKRLILASHYVGGEEAVRCSNEGVVGFQEVSGTAIFFQLPSLKILPKESKSCAGLKLGCWMEIPLQLEAA